MASNINYQDINESFPVAGVDNDSQGFRDNFGTIKNSLQEAKTEIDVLQNTTIKNNADNLMNFNKIQQVELVQAQFGFNSIGTIQTNTTIEYNRGHYQAFALSYDTATLSNVVLQLVNWPDDGYGKITLQIVSEGGDSRTVVWDTEDSGIFKYSAAYTAALTGGNFVVSSATTETILEFWTYDGGRNVYVDYKGQFSI
jgi:hypothetical protein